MNNIEKALFRLDPSAPDFDKQYIRRKMKLDHIDDLKNADSIYMSKLLSEILMIQWESDFSLRQYQRQMLEQTFDSFLKEQPRRGLRSTMHMYDDFVLGKDENGNRIYSSRE